MFDFLLADDCRGRAHCRGQDVQPDCARCGHGWMRWNVRLPRRELPLLRPHSHATASGTADRRSPDIVRRAIACLPAETEPRRGGEVPLDAASQRLYLRRCRNAADSRELRRAHRHALGGLGRRPDAGARRLLHGALLDRGGPARPGRARAARRPVRTGAARRRRIAAPQGASAAIDALPIANIPAILTAAGTVGRLRDRLRRLRAVRFPRARHRIHPARLGRAGHARGGAAARAGAGRPRRRRRLRHADPGFFQQPDYWALYIYLAIVTAASFALARIRLWRWLAITTIVFALLWTFPCLECMDPKVGPHVFHVIAGFVLAALLVVCGFMFGPPAEEGRIEPISSGFACGLSARRHR